MIPDIINNNFLQHPSEIQERLKIIRSVFLQEIPNATETISYGLPTFKLKKNIIHYAAFKNHIGIFPGADGVVYYLSKYQGYKTSKGTIQIPHDAEIPVALLIDLARFKLHEYQKKINNGL